MLKTIVKDPIRLRLFGYKILLIVLYVLIINFPLSAQLLSSSKILLTFSEPMSRENIFNPANYIVTANDNIPVEIIKVGLVIGDTSVVLFFYKEDGWQSFQITVQNLKDKAGNLISNEKNFTKIIPALQNNIPVTVLDEK